MKKLKLSYCPTMLPYINKLIDNKIDLEIVNGMSAAGVLAMLRNREVDMIIIGRKAYKRELNLEIKEKRIKNGYTLAYSHKTSISKERLKELAIKTYIPKVIVEKDFSFFEQVEYFDSKKDCMKNSFSTPTLVDWNDFEEEYELLIPMDENRNKLNIFRAPVVYYNENIDESLIKEIDRILK
ncbi:hypothetical protein [Helicovermis profundi]|uniref:LysR substrate-binding domain-containing protein n=1 Tax=Helicovermis profundi TaxID=3065157 RepID=A0AAU9EQQ6_9FIRM|nr:hypothetical protein HLPR_20370 [Clostridia bacterium S502]